MTVPTTPPAARAAPGFEEVERFTSVDDEYAAMRDGVAVLDRSARLRMLATGPKAAEALNGLVTNDVAALAPGMGHFAAALTPKGKIIADLRVFARDDDLLIDAPAAAAAGFAAMIRKFVNPRLATFTDRSAELRSIAVCGPRSAGVVAEALGMNAASLAQLAPYHHLAAVFDAVALRVAAIPDLGIPALELFVPVEAATALWMRLAVAGAQAAGSAAVDIVRVEAGRPLWGVDMDENTLAQEANFDELAGISYTKGCYTGQETVARVHFRGHVNRSLRGLSSAQLLPRSAQLFAAGGEAVGDARSSVISPRLGPIAIAMVRRSVPDGAELTARWDGGECAAQTRELRPAPGME